ncbi:MAG: hypothetical protein RLO50_01980 [Azospirillaceae bacterium]
MPDSTESPALVPATPGALPISQRVLQEWLRAAKAGERLIYHRGFLVCDRDRLTSKLSPAKQRALNAVASDLHGLAMKNRVQLVQCRVDAGIFEYWAIKQTRR